MATNLQISQNRFLSNVAALPAGGISIVPSYHELLDVRDYLALFADLVDAHIAEVCQDADWAGGASFDEASIRGAVRLALDEAGVFKAFEDQAIALRVGRAA